MQNDRGSEKGGKKWDLRFIEDKVGKWLQHQKKSVKIGGQCKGEFKVGGEAKTQG